MCRIEIISRCLEICVCMELGKAIIFFGSLHSRVTKCFDQNLIFHREIVFNKRTTWYLDTIARIPIYTIIVYNIYIINVIQ